MSVGRNGFRLGGVVPPWDDVREPWWVKLMRWPVAGAYVSLLVIVYQVLGSDLESPDKLKGVITCAVLAFTLGAVGLWRQKDDDGKTSEFGERSGDDRPGKG